jgi:hypothetical protein
MRIVARVGMVGLTVGVLGWLGTMTAVAAQTLQSAPAPAPAPVIVSPPLPPATMLEGFRPAIGSVLTLGFEDLGEVDGVSVDVREMRDTHGGRVRGLVVEVRETQTIREQSFVDADEIPELLNGLDALIAVTANPTQFRSFEIRYTTKGELDLVASSSRNRGILYSVTVGRLLKARRGGLNAGEMHQLRTLFEAASQKLATLAPDK